MGQMFAKAKNEDETVRPLQPNMHVGRGLQLKAVSACPFTIHSLPSPNRLRRRRRHRGLAVLAHLVQVLLLARQPPDY